jgi:hypothetical protein
MYSESVSGVPYELSLLTTGVGINDLQQTVRIITLLHETSHFIHDLSIGACLNRDFLLDEAAAVLFPLTASIAQNRKLVCPLLSEKTLMGMEHEEQRMLTFITERGVEKTDCLSKAATGRKHGRG